MLCRTGHAATGHARIEKAAEIGVLERLPHVSSEAATEQRRELMPPRSERLSELSAAHHGLERLLLVRLGHEALRLSRETLLVLPEEVLRLLRGVSLLERRLHHRTLALPRHLHLPHLVLRGAVIRSSV